MSIVGLGALASRQWSVKRSQARLVQFILTSSKRQETRLGEGEDAQSLESVVADHSLWHNTNGI